MASVGIHLHWDPNRWYACAQPAHKQTNTTQPLSVLVSSAACSPTNNKPKTTKSTVAALNQENKNATTTYSNSNFYDENNNNCMSWLHALGILAQIIASFHFFSDQFSILLRYVMLYVMLRSLLLLLLMIKSKEAEKKCPHPISNFTDFSSCFPPMRCMPLVIMTDVSIFSSSPTFSNSLINDVMAQRQRVSLNVLGSHDKSQNHFEASLEIHLRNVWGTKRTQHKMTRHQSTKQMFGCFNWLFFCSTWRGT